MSYLNNALVYLFNSFEEVTGYNFPNFMTNETPSSVVSQPLMQQQRQRQNQTPAPDNGAMYKYLFDPNLTFGFRFHQRIAKIKYEDRKQPWVTIMFNTGEVRPLTNVLSTINEQIRIQKRTDDFYDVSVRKVLTPVNLVFISNDIDYLYSYLQKLSFYFDRITQYDYQQRIQYPNGHVTTYPLVGMAKDIIQKDLTKLDTEKRGSLATAGFSFDLIYYVMDTPLRGYLLEDIDLQIKFLNNPDYLCLSHIHHH